MGGHTFLNTEPIRLGLIKPTLEQLLMDLKTCLNITEYTVIGSTYKKPISNDIDILIRGDQIGRNADVKIYNTLKQIYPNFQVSHNKGLKVSNIAYPIYGEKGFVQIDLMVTYGKYALEYGKFIYHSPFQHTSKYSGAQRTNLLYTLCRYIDTHVSEREYFEDGSLKTFKKYSLLPKGLYLQEKTFEGKKGRIKTAWLKKQKFITNNPTRIINILFGKMVSLQDFDSVETIFSMLERLPLFNETKKEIYEYFNHYITKL